MNKERKESEMATAALERRRQSQPTQAEQPQADPPTHAEDPILNLSEAGRVCGKSPMTMKRWCMDGLLNYVPLPSGLWGIRRSELNKFLGGSALSNKQAS